MPPKALCKCLTSTFGRSCVSCVLVLVLLVQLLFLLLLLLLLLCQAGMQSRVPILPYFDGYTPAAIQTAQLQRRETAPLPLAQPSQIEPSQPQPQPPETPQPQRAGLPPGPGHDASHLVGRSASSDSVGSVDTAGLSTPDRLQSKRAKLAKLKADKEVKRQAQEAAANQPAAAATLDAAGDATDGSTADTAATAPVVSEALQRKRERLAELKRKKEAKMQQKRLVEEESTSSSADQGEGAAKQDAAAEAEPVGQAKTPDGQGVHTGTDTDVGDGRLALAPAAAQEIPDLQDERNGYITVEGRVPNSGDGLNASSDEDEDEDSASDEEDTEDSEAQDVEEHLLQVYESLWAMAGGNDQGHVGPGKAVSFFRESQLSTELLGSIWDQADSMPPHGQLSRPEFFAALDLIASEQLKFEAFADAFVPDLGVHTASVISELEGEDRPPALGGVYGQQYATQAPPANTAPAPSHAASVPQSEPLPVLTLQAVASHLLNLAGTDEQGYVPGAGLRDLIARSNLGIDTLATIWNTVDVSMLGRLQPRQLTVLLGLISQAQRGEQLAVHAVTITTLPPVLQGITPDSYVYTP